MAASWKKGDLAEFVDLRDVDGNEENKLVVLSADEDSQQVLVYQENDPASVGRFTFGAIRPRTISQSTLQAPSSGHPAR
jgi:hypothetical protein